MIWDLQSAVVVMCTDLTEMGKKKCFKYFPEPGEAMRAGGLLVKDVVVEQQTAHYEVRQDFFLLGHFLRCSPLLPLHARRVMRSTKCPMLTGC